MIDQLHVELKKYWGYDKFRDLQQEIIVSILTKNDTLALLPTGGGKSICYQVPAVYSKKLCLVISPLIALMKDQVQNLSSRGISAAAIYSGMSFNEIDRILDHAVHGKYSLLYVSPERLETDVFKARIERFPLAMIAVDEAHCISEWGYDFRPSYLKIASLRKFLPDIPILALTATATPEVQQDIMQKLEFRNPKHFQKSFERNNLVYAVVYDEAKLKKIAQILKNTSGSSIVYVRTRKHSKEIADFLQTQDIRADFYHAGLEQKTRNEKQEAWMKNRFRVIVATNAFGMGIDKADVRVVVHADLPDSLEAYYQEAGRAGRDLKKSYAVAVVNELDKQELADRIERSFPDKKELLKTYEALCNFYQIPIGSGELLEFSFNIHEFCSNYDLNLLSTYTILKSLQQQALIQLTESVFLASRLLILPVHTELYDFQLRNPKFEPLIKTLLRSYTGLYDNFTKIDEDEIAKRLNSKREIIVRYLQHLAKLKIIEYIPATTTPKIIFLQNRPPKNAFPFDYVQVQKRKSIAEKKIRSVLHYSFVTDHCRSNILLNYFGEKTSKNCGHCDFCLRIKQSGLQANEFEKIYQKILAIIKEKPLRSSEIMKEIPGFPKEKVIYAVRWLIDQGMIREDSNLNLYLKK
jgi:ATP-dependent DNA helicase RecQ